jgi:hypothetical protein
MDEPSNNPTDLAIPYYFASSAESAVTTLAQVAEGMQVSVNQ